MFLVQWKRAGTQILVKRGKRQGLTRLLTPLMTPTSSLSGSERSLSGMSFLVLCQIMCTERSAVFYLIMMFYNLFPPGECSVDVNSYDR